MSQSYNVYVSATYLGARENKSLSTSSFSMMLNVTSSYVSDVTVSMDRRICSLESLHKSKSQIKEIKNPSMQRSFEVPCHTVMSDIDATSSSSSLWDFITKMLSDMDIPFSLDRIQWRANPTDGWISLGNNQDDVIRQIMSFARCIASKVVSTADDQPKELRFLLSIKKEIVVPHNEFGAIVNARRTEEEAQKILEAINWANQQPYEMRRLFFRDLRASPQYTSFQSLIERAIRESEEAKSKLIPAAKSSIKALREVIFDGKDSTCSSCTICMEKLVIGSSVTKMPCSHVFHNSCIVSWLKTSHMCPLCRFKLPTT